MNQTNNLQEVVNENDEIIGLEEKKKVLAEGLLRRVTHVWFFTPKGELIFQHRAKDKDIFPDLLDITVGGKVEPGDSYEYTAVKEMEEETGVKAKAENLILIDKFRFDFVDPKTNIRNNIFAKQFLYRYKGKLEDLVPEEGKIQGFVAYPIEKFSNLTEEDQKLFIMEFINSEPFRVTIDKIKSLLN